MIFDNLHDSRVDEMRPLHILVIDDEQATLRSIAVVLEDAGHKVTSADSARTALDLLKRGRKSGEDPFQFLLLDIHMPGMTGPELLDELENQDVRLPSLAITGLAETETAERLRGKGCHILEKPFHGEQLLECISTILQPPQQFPDI